MLKLLRPPLKPLSDALQGAHAIRVDSLETLFQEQKAAVFLLSPPTLRLAEHFDLDIDLLIVDPRIRTIGVVKILGATPDAGAAKQFIDQAVYVCHLLLTEFADRPADSYTVEAVLVVPGDYAGLESALREIARETAFLHAIGVNVLKHSGNSPIDASEFRRAFSWLLAATRGWLGDAPTGSAQAALEKLTLRNFRLPGERCWVIDRDSAVHLVFGQNGSGKSSLAEALEIVTTGTLERLERSRLDLQLQGKELDYDAIIRNTNAASPAEIVLEFAGQPPQTKAITKGGVADSLDSSIRVTSFRLDQILMDNLTRHSSTERAKVFMGSFFPKDPTYDELEAAEAALKTAYDKLPLDIRQAMPCQPSAIAARLGWLAAGEPPGVDHAQDCLPIPMDAIRGLAPLDTAIREFVRDWPKCVGQSDYAGRLSTLGKGLDRVRPSAVAFLENVRTARQALLGMNDWTPAGSAAAGGDWIDLLNEWLENTALADLAEKHWQLSKILSGAKQAGWINPAGAAGLFDAVPGNLTKDADLKLLEDLRTKAIQQRDSLLAQLTQWKETQAPTSASRAVAELYDPQIRALDVAGPWLSTSTDQSAQPFGRAVYHALQTDSTGLFGNITIGGTGWANEPIHQLSTVDVGLEALRSVEASDAARTTAGAAASPFYCGPDARLEMFRDVLQESGEVTVKQNAMQAAFARKLADDKQLDGAQLANGKALWEGALNGALNELMALFTPARWAYRDLIVEYQQEAGRRALNLNLAGNAPAELRLNTAELNIFTIALYLLCVARQPNPLGLLVFDDPMQNMDELTVAAVARGIAKIMRIFPPMLRLVFLFHGENDLERFHREVRGAVYYLPWLSPAGEVSPGRLEIRPEKEPPPPSPASLAALIKPAPKQSRGVPAT